MRNILVVTPNYPIEGNPVYPFVKKLCDEFAKNGWKVTVLANQSVTSSLLHHKSRRPKMRSYYIGGEEVVVYQPYTITPPHGLLWLYNYMIRLSILRFLRKNKLMPDVCYCHFWCSAYWVMPYMKKYNIPVFVASGESQIKTLLYSGKQYPDFINYVKGVISVSGKNKDESIGLGYTTENKCIVMPNAVDSKHFYKRDKLNCRRKLSLPEKDFIVVFVGWFIERKGPLRVAEAIRRVDGVKSFFIGKGPQEPQCEGILYKGTMPHEDIPLYLGAADCFVLPTLHEGCCNAVVEALACGLPVISSNLPFNWDVLDETNSIMVNPQNIDEIANAIQELRDNPQKRELLAGGALKKAESLTIDQRAKKIMNFIEERL